MSVFLKIKRSYLFHILNELLDPQFPGTINPAQVHAMSRRAGLGGSGMVENGKSGSGSGGHDAIRFGVAGTQSTGALQASL